ncbi:hypothetical protein HGRIS_006305 [Hohenbuehelia grisea]|uniref:DUF6534 domain-containing protein n=1 Tax=Hohenbuehelia grisea TaxID=104357 RepID=A0ABR3K0N9_9AGAR
MVEIPDTLGALLVGGLIATAFSGVVTVQAFSYFKSYSNDPPRLKLLVFAVWMLDFCHAIFASISLWHYLITNFGRSDMISSIPWSLAITIALTAILTFLVHCFFVHRIFKISFGNWLITLPLGLLAVARLCFACLTTSQMIILDTLDEFVQKFHWSFTLGLALSSAIDVLITGSLCFFLSNNRKPASSLNLVIDTLMIYAFENGALTCAATVISMICWLAMPHNLIFMGLHFVISKLYANSLLATLNTRKALRSGSRNHFTAEGAADPGIPVVLTQDFAETIGGGPLKRLNQPRTDAREKRVSRSPRVHINVQKTIECTVDEGCESPYLKELDSPYLKDDEPPYPKGPDSV